jgi:hypothetical protein
MISLLSLLPLCVIILGALSLTGVVTSFVIHRADGLPRQEHIYLLTAEDAACFDEIVSATLAHDPDFASHCRELLDHGD